MKKVIYMSKIKYWCGPVKCPQSVRKVSIERLPLLLSPIEKCCWSADRHEKNAKKMALRIVS